MDTKLFALAMKFASSDSMKRMAQLGSEGEQIFDKEVLSEFLPILTKFMISSMVMGKESEAKKFIEDSLSVYSDFGTDVVSILESMAAENKP